MNEPLKDCFAQQHTHRDGACGVSHLKAKHYPEKQSTFFFFFVFCILSFVFVVVVVVAISWAAPAAYGGSQARGPIGVVAAAEL